jgi:Cft2 family RNA processing exonuclease
MTRYSAKPGDFPLGSSKSRAAARALIQQMAEKNRPQGGDVLIQLEATGWPDRHREILLILNGRGRLESRPKRIPGIPLLWLALPAGLVRNSCW